MLMNPILPRSFRHLSDWCYLYQHSNIAPRTQADRFAIGVYQVSQGIAWKCAGPVAWQSYCSAALHWICCAHAHNIDLTNDMPETLAEIPDTWTDWRGFVKAQGDVQQQVIYYCSHNLNTTRASRYKPDVFRERMVRLIGLVLSLVPPADREQGCHDEMMICTKDLLRKATEPAPQVSKACRDILIADGHGGTIRIPRLSPDPLYCCSESEKDET
jgi:hypothetical protein